ncbi:hypothetical protein MT325_m394L [Paramecium bursaria chlorella virus MT325]|uniref:Uncharacterized protein m394L n=1 Tax=Paramecium bursaria Chlorella virus MT325 TaxID=346932 RepID=A7IUC4_PBCVM|nr:hypothetical protein MT325_m394L [Paramecium bursaria chlorella virus MT325]
MLRSLNSIVTFEEALLTISCMFLFISNFEKSPHLANVSISDIIILLLMFSVGNSFFNDSFQKFSPIVKNDLSTHATRFASKFPTNISTLFSTTLCMSAMVFFS